MPSNRPIRVNARRAYSFDGQAGVTSRTYRWTTTEPLQFEHLQYHADACDSTDKFLVVFSVKDPAGTTRAYVTGTNVTTPDVPLSFTTLDSTALPGGFIPVGSTILMLITFAGTAANVLGWNVRLECSVAH